MDMGFEPDRLIVAMPEFDDGALPRAEVTPFYEAVLRRVRALPAVEDAAAVGALPFYWSLATSFEIPGREELPTFSDGGPYIYPVTHDYLSTAGIRVLRGRGFTAADDASAPRVMIVGENLAAAYWPDENPLGKCIHVNDDDRCTRVVGVAEAANRGSFTRRSSAQYYVPISQWPEAFTPRAVVVRVAAGEVDGLVPAVRREVQGASAAVRFVDVRAFRELIDPQARSWELGATLFSAFGVLALVIASVGLYGVLAFAVAQRRHEIGVRSALGASARGLIALVAGQAARLVFAGLVVGIVGALAVAPYVQPMLFDVDARDPWVLAAVALVLAAVAAVAAGVPAFRAARVQPVIALRRD
jgi:predicted permease